MADSDALALAQAGDHCLAKGLFGEALQYYQQALQREPGNMYWQFLAAESLFHLGSYADTVALLAGLNPGEDAVFGIEVAMTLGRALHAMGLTDQAEASLLKAYILDPANEQAAYNLAVFYEHEHLPHQAVQFLQPAAAMHPQSLPLHFNLGSNLVQCGATVRAIQALEATLQLSAGHIRAHQNLALCYLQTGALLAGWTHYAWRFNRHTAEGGAANWIPHTPELSEDLRGQEVIVKGEQGIGDELFFMRFLPELNHRGAKVTYLPCNTKLIPLLKSLQASGLFALCSDAQAIDPNAIQVYAADLPLALGEASASSYPPAVRLQTDVSLSDAWRQELPALRGSRPKLGITWRAGTQQAYSGADRNRWLSKSVPLDALMDVLVPLDVDIVVLQRNPTAEELQYVQSRIGAERYLDASRCGDDLVALLGLLDCVDSLVGVSNTNIHLFAGLGKTGHVLVPVPYEFRWQEEGDVSPWFPGFKVYRQCPDTGWDEPMVQLSMALNRTFARKPGFH